MPELIWDGKYDKDGNRLPTTCSFGKSAGGDVIFDPPAGEPLRSALFQASVPAQFVRRPADALPPRAAGAPKR